MDTGEAHQGSSGGAPGDWERLIKHLIKEMVTRCVVVALALPEKKKKKKRKLMNKLN